MNSEEKRQIAEAKKAAVEVLLHNSKGTVANLPRTAGWGYPEPYTRDLMISILGIGVSGNTELIESLRKTLLALSENQSEDGQIPSLVNDKNNKGSSDTTPLFLMAVAIFRTVIGEADFLENAVSKALKFLEYQCPTNQLLIAQQPTSDWRDEQWVLGYGLFVNILHYSALKFLSKSGNWKVVGASLRNLTYSSDQWKYSKHEGLAIADKPYFALWSYKIYSSDRFDLLGNSLAILSGLVQKEEARKMINWIEGSCDGMITNNDLIPDQTPNFFPFIQPEDEDWIKRYYDYNLPGDYHNGGIWPFISGFYIAALVAAEEYQLAEKKLLALTSLIRKGKNPKLKYKFNEWHKAQTGEAMGQDWQTWSASNYLYAAACVEKRQIPFFEEIRTL